MTETTEKLEPSRVYHLTETQRNRLASACIAGAPNDGWGLLGQELQFRPETVRDYRQGPGGDAFRARPTRRVHARVTEEMVTVATQAYDAVGAVSGTHIACGMRTALTAVFDRLDASTDDPGVVSRNAVSNEVESSRDTRALKDLADMGAPVPLRMLRAAGIDDPLTSIENAILDESYSVTLRVTTCVLTLRGGYQVVGNNLPAIGADFDSEKGRRLARDKAVAEALRLERYASLRPATPASESRKTHGTA